MDGFERFHLFDNDHFENEPFRSCSIVAYRSGYLVQLSVKTKTNGNIDMVESGSFIDRANVDINEGIVMQFWFDGSETTCRLINPHTRRMISTSIPHEVIGGGAIHLSAVNNGNSVVDYVRVYSLE